ncbi:hypothetical protein BJ508DRAFT_410328 [Ascobolus immersus RN42]|uniref:RNA polymerase II subunit B1 CTD phosphatase RPAP2 homolog n=1 Tax=Ascobolus immersus RN42 TaxID=1160509 RepID=A0A3N4IP86_ASCIM|nr:hypothetical protein BJ508DRAFT_410328 [Ascobolus immersus RN42]
MTPPAPKPILKKKAASSSTPTATSVSIQQPPPKPEARTGRDGKPLPTPEEARRIAIIHAKALELRKKVELSILRSIEVLIDYPPPNPAGSNAPQPTAAQPRTEDVIQLKYHLRHFQRTDYDELIVERNVLSKCGFPLCPRERRRLPGNARYKALHGATKFVEREKLERFCGEDCTKRGLWLRLQLQEEPAWMRRGVDESTVDFWMPHQNVLLLEEHRPIPIGETGRTIGQFEVAKLAQELEEIGISASNSQNVHSSVKERDPKTIEKPSHVMLPAEEDFTTRASAIVDPLPQQDEEEREKKGGKGKEREQEKETASEGKEEQQKEEDDEIEEPDEGDISRDHSGFLLSPEEEELIRQYQEETEKAKAAK